MNSYLRKYFLFLSLTFQLLFSFQLFGQSFVTQTYTQEEGLPSSNVHAMIQDKLGRMWFGTRNGVAVYDGLDWSIYNMNNGLPENEINDLKIDSSGCIWALCSRTRFHIAYYKDNVWRRLKNDPINEPDAFARSFDVITTNNKTEILITSERNGIFYFDGNTWQNITTDSGLPSDFTSNVCILNKSFYVATQKGIAVLTNGKVDVSINRIIPENCKKILALKIF